jgi:hypothetical protein
MTGSLIIEQIVLRKAKPERLKSAIQRQDIRWYDLTVQVKNTSGEATLYVISDIRRIQYDAGRRVLSVNFGEHDTPALSVGDRHAFPPKFVAVRAGETALLSSRLSSPVTFFEQTTETGLKLKHVSISDDVDLIECLVAYDTSPPPQSVNLLARNELRGRDWGTTARATWTPSGRSEKEVGD